MSKHIDTLNIIRAALVEWRRDLAEAARSKLHIEGMPVDLVADLATTQTQIETIDRIIAEEKNALQEVDPSAMIG